MAALRVEYQISGCTAHLDGEFSGNDAQIKAESAAAWCERFADVVWIRDENGRLVACSFADNR
jgi:hypothetical protein